MGISSDGIVAFGFPLGDEDFEFPERMTAYLDKDDEDEEFDFDDFICAEAGVSDAPYEVRKAHIEACPVELVKYCSYDYPMCFLAIRGTEKRACRGYCEEFMPESHNWAEMKEFCDKYGIEWREPGWHVMSMYG